MRWLKCSQKPQLKGGVPTRGRPAALETPCQFPEPVPELEGGSDNAYGCTGVEHPVYSLDFRLWRL